MLGNMTTPVSVCVAERIPDEYGIPVEKIRQVKRPRCWCGGRGAISYSGWSRDKKTAEDDTTVYSTLELFRFRAFKDYVVTTDNFLIFGGTVDADGYVTGWKERFDIQAVETLKGNGMYVELIAKRVDMTMGGK